MPAKKRKAVQEPLLGVDTRPREPTRVEHRANFAAMAVGTGIGNDRVTVNCPVCFEVCMPERSPLKWRFVHTGTFVATEKATRFRPSRRCEVDAAIIEQMASERPGALKLKDGALVSVEQHAPQRVEELLKAQAERRKLTEARA